MGKIFKCARCNSAADKLRRERIALVTEWNARKSRAHDPFERDRVETEYAEKYFRLTVMLTGVTHKTGVVDAETGEWYPSEEEYHKKQRELHVLDAEKFFLRPDVFGVQVGYRAETDGAMVWSVVYGLTTKEPYVVERQFNVASRKYDNVERVLKGTMLQKVKTFARACGLEVTE